MRTAPSNQDQRPFWGPDLKLAKRIAEIGGHAILRPKNGSGNRIIQGSKEEAGGHAQLLTDVVSVKEGLLMKIAVPLASRQTSFTVFHAIPVPIPQYEKDKVIMWKTEAPYLAISEDNMETAALTEYNLIHCLGSSRYQICHKTIPTETRHGSCLATLFFKGNLDTLKVCDTEQIQLTSTKNLGFGVWLITSAKSACTLFESDIESTTASWIEKFPGCHICIVTLDCEKQLVGPNLKYWSHLATCEQLPAIKINVHFEDPISNLLSELPKLEDMPYYDPKTEAGIELFKEVRKKLEDMPSFLPTWSLSKKACLWRLPFH